MGIKVGHKIVFLSEKGGGVVIEITSNGHFIIEDEHGLKKECLRYEIGPVYNEDYKIEGISVSKVEKVKQDLKKTNKQLKSIKTGAKQGVKSLEVDLHIEELVDSHRNLTNFEIVSKQLSVLRSSFSKARNTRVRKLIIIHGRGEGVLKSEVVNFLNKQDAIRYYDGDFREFGQGATVVELFYL